MSSEEELVNNKKSNKSKSEKKHKKEKKEKRKHDEESEDNGQHVDHQSSQSQSSQTKKLKSIQNMEMDVSPVKTTKKKHPLQRLLQRRNHKRLLYISPRFLLTSKSPKHFHTY